MSKAFTREDGGTEAPLWSARPRAPAGTRRYITPEGWRALQEELSALAGPAQGSAAALGEQLQAEERARRVHQLSAVLDEVQVVEGPPPDPARVYFGAWVVLEDEEGAEVRYRLVGPDEADVRQGRLSVQSPLARALLGKEVGDAVRLERPGGAVEYTLQAIHYGAPPQSL